MQLDGLVGDLVDEVGAPVPLLALGVERVEHALEPGERDVVRAVQDRLGERVHQRRHVLDGLLLAAEVAPDDAAHLAQVDVLGERRSRRDRVVAEEAVELARSVGDEVAVGGEHLDALLDRPEGRSGEHGVHLVCPEPERGDDPEVAAAAAQRPEEVGVLVGARRHLTAVREHDLGVEQVVDAEAVLAREVPEPAAEREAADTGGGDDAARHGEPVLVGRAIDLAQRAAAADAHGPRLRVDLDRVQRRQVDDDSVVARAEARAVVPAAAYGDQQIPLACEGDDLRDVGSVGAARDQRGVAVDHRVVDGSRVVVVAVARLDQPAAEAGQLLTGVDESGHAATL